MNARGLKLHGILTILVGLVFINSGVGKLFTFGTLISKEFSPLLILHAIELITIGLFFLLVECNSPLFKKNIRLMYRPISRSIIVLVLSVFLFLDNPYKFDFYIAISSGSLMIILTKCCTK